MTRALDYYKYVLGSSGFFEPFADMLNQLDKTNFPPYNIRKITSHSSNGTILEMACAGFKKSDISISVEDDILTITGSISPGTEKDIEYIYKGIAERGFKRQFIMQGVKVASATLEDGLLKVKLEKLPVAGSKRVEIPIDNKQLLQE
jgi:molecular chaperone IbpA